MSSDYDIEMTTDDTLELDTIIEKSNKPIDPVTKVDTLVSYDVGDLDGIQTNTAIFDPTESGEYNIHVNGQVLSINVTDASAILDSVVTRSPDDSSKTESSKYGIAIESTEEWSAIGGRISGNTSLTNAYIQEVNADDTLGTVLGSTDVSNLTSGDTFTIDLITNIQPNTRYAFVGDAEGSSYTRGYVNVSYPIPSPDGNLEMVAGVAEGIAAGGAGNLFDKIGDVGFN